MTKRSAERRYDARSTAEIGRALHDRSYVDKATQDRLDLEEARKRIAATSKPKSKRMAGYKRNSRLDDEHAEGERHAAEVEAAQRKKKR